MSDVAGVSDNAERERTCELFIKYIAPVMNSSFKDILRKYLYI